MYVPYIQSPHPPTQDTYAFPHLDLKEWNYNYRILGNHSGGLFCFPRSWKRRLLPLLLKPHSDWLLALQQTWRPGNPPAGEYVQCSQLASNASVDFAIRANRPSLKEAKAAELCFPAYFLCFIKQEELVSVRNPESHGRNNLRSVFGGPRAWKGTGKTGITVSTEEKGLHLWGRNGQRFWSWPRQ